MRRLKHGSLRSYGWEREKANPGAEPEKTVVKERGAGGVENLGVKNARSARALNIKPSNARKGVLSRQEKVALEKLGAGRAMVLDTGRTRVLTEESHPIPARDDNKWVRCWRTVKMVSIVRMRK